MVALRSFYTDLFLYPVSIDIRTYLLRASRMAIQRKLIWNWMEVGQRTDDANAEDKSHELLRG